MLKRCSCCKAEKSAAAFYNNKNKADGKASRCIECHNSPARRARQSELRRARYCPEKNKDGQLRKNFGITLLDYNAMLKSQLHACAICGRSNGLDKRQLSVDHCHTTGSIRGLLCDNCNHILGKAKDDTAVLRAAITYLDNHNGHHPPSPCPAIGA